jgi:aminoglycoside 6'-N-acetyltransferase
MTRESYSWGALGPVYGQLLWRSWAAERMAVVELPTIEGERLTLRPLTDADVEILLPAIYEPGTVEWWGDTSDPDYQREGLRNEGNAFAIVVDDEVAGWLSFDEETEPDYRQVAFDILLRPTFQHQGLGADALRLLIRWFIDARGHHHFTIDPSAKNDRAIKAYASIGFKPVGILRKAERAPDGHWRDSLLMDLLADDLS